MCNAKNFISSVQTSASGTRGPDCGYPPDPDPHEDFCPDPDPQKKCGSETLILGLSVLLYLQHGSLRHVFSTNII